MKRGGGATLAECLATFRAWIALERGLAPKTLEAYDRDVRFFLGFLAGRGHVKPGDVTRADVVDYIGKLRTERRRASTRARAFVSLREFLHHLKDEGHVAVDVAEGLDSPKKGRTLPRVLDEGAMQRLVTSVSGESPRDLRDRAMLEMLYGCGLRVSELCSLDVRDFIADAEVVRCRGKGSKERIVPMGVECGRAVRSYLEGARAAFAKGNADETHLFVTRRAKPFSRMGVFKMLRERAVAAGEVKKAQAVAIYEKLLEIAYEGARQNEAGWVLPGLGKLLIKKQGARKVRNPQTGETIKKPACKVAKFRLAKAAKDALVPPKVKK